MQHTSLLTIGGGLLVLSLLAFSQPDSSLPGAPQDPGGRYIGSNACKACHAGKEKGEAYDIWSNSPHAKAFETLATPAALAIAKKQNIADPQKDAKCLECHTTGFGAAAKDIKRGFKAELGVQCESCHGPGETHQKTRMKEAMKPGAVPAPIAAGEIITDRSLAMCTKCHNPKSPTYKPFCLKERMAKIEHYDPRKNRTEEELKKLRETDDPNCEVHPPKKDGDGK